MTRAFLPRLGVLAALLAAGGCGSGTGTVTGKVTFKSKPVVTGTVTAIGSDGVARPGTIGSDGAFSISAVPNGEVKFLVASPNPDAGTRESIGKKKGGGDGDLAGGAAAGPGTSIPKGAWMPLPEEYSLPDKTNLKKSVKGDTVIELELN